jgi:SAM-dependent methyltransferase
MKNATDAPGLNDRHGAGFEIAPGEQPSPWLLKYACAVNGVAAHAPGKYFVYCQIGCAEGNDLLCMAAANPDGVFLGIQTDGAILAPAEALRAAAGVGNCTFIERPLAELEGLDIPPIDFLVLRGVLSRDDPAARRAAAAFVARHLKPGGLVLCSYRTPHAWAFWEPVLHFLRAAAEAPGDRKQNIQQGLRELHALRAAGAALFQISPLMTAIVDSIGEFDLLAFDQAFLRTPIRLLHFDEVCDAMQGLGLRHAAALPLAVNYPAICLPAGLKERLASLPGLRLRETWKDLVRMPFFRQDIFTSAAAAERPELPGETVFGAHLPRDQFQFSFDIPGAAAVRLDGPLFQHLADRLAQNALPLAAILATPVLKAFAAEEILSALAWLTAMEQIRPFACAVQEAGASLPFRLSRFNTAVLQQQLRAGPAEVRLASWTLGNSLALNPREALALLALSEAGAEQAEDWAGRWLVNHALAGDGAPQAPSLGQILQQARANPGSLAALGLSEKERCI